MKSAAGKPAAGCLATKRQGNLWLTRLRRRAARSLRSRACGLEDRDCTQKKAISDKNKGLVLTAYNKKRELLANGKEYINEFYNNPPRNYTALKHILIPMI